LEKLGEATVDRRFFGVGETAQILGITQRAVRKRIARGELPFRRWGKRVLIPARELEVFMEGLPGRNATEALIAAEERRES
jgi:excisionase family DNA binding protein